MRILYIDIDSLRPDHLGCYGYHRATSPNIDRVAAQGVRYTNCHAPDVPCLPSRTALFSGRFGMHTGVVNHGGVAAQPCIEGPGRLFRDRFGTRGWMAALREAGFKTTAISPFGERHSAWHWYAGFNEIHNTGMGGQEIAHDVGPVVDDWLQRNATRDKWFLHVNFWDPHTPYRTPADHGNRFQDDPIPNWFTEEVRARHWSEPGPHSAQEVLGWHDVNEWPPAGKFPRQPRAIPSLAEARAMFDGYDMGVWDADAHVGRILDRLASLHVLDETVVLISSDHGENLGELNIYGDHQTADRITTRVPFIVRWPGITDDQRGRTQPGLHYSLDLAATVLECAGAEVPSDWDGASHAAALRRGASAGRDALVVSQAAWTCQRGVRWGSYHGVLTYHDGFHAFPEMMVFDVERDPHEQVNLAPDHPELVSQLREHLARWHAEMARTATHPTDPLVTTLLEGGPFHVRGQLPAYLERLRATGRAAWADRLATRPHPFE